MPNIKKPTTQKGLRRRSKPTKKRIIKPIFGGPAGRVFQSQKFEKRERKT